MGTVKRVCFCTLTCKVKWSRRTEAPRVITKSVLSCTSTEKPPNSRLIIRLEQMGGGALVGARTGNQVRHAHFAQRTLTAFGMRHRRRDDAGGHEFVQTPSGCLGGIAQGVVKNDLAPAPRFHM